MNDRQMKLLRILLTVRNESLLVQDLAKKLQCSEKTVRNDFIPVEEFIKRYSDASFIRKPGVGVYLEIDLKERSQLFHLLQTKESKSDDERTMEIAYQLLVSNKPIRLQQFADQYYIHKTAIKNDIKKMERWLKEYDLRLISKQRVGNQISGSELNKRNALAHLFELIPSVSGTMNYVLSLFLPVEISAVNKAVQDLQETYAIVFTDGAMESLLVHALIMIKRTRQRSTMKIPESEKESVNQTMEYNYTKSFIAQLEDAFSMSFPEDEVIYFTWHLISCKKREEQPDNAVSSHDNVTKIVEEITSKLNQLIMINFKDDSLLMNGLTVHMDTVLSRITYGFPVSNPLLPDIKKMYPYMFSMIVLALEDLNKLYDLNIPEDEAAYLVLHFQASIERLQGKREETKNALVVCHMGIGMSHLLQAKIEQQYKGIHILGCVGKVEVDDFLEHNSVDYIVSTVPLKKINTPHIVVSPLLEAKDKEKLDQFFYHSEDDRTDYQVNSYLSQFIDNDLIFLDVDREHRFEVVEMLANELYEKGAVDEAFVHSTLYRERSSATSIGGSVAIPHGSPSHVKHSAVAIAVLAKPLEWGDEMVTMVLMLAISNESNNPTKELIQQIISISKQPLWVKALETSKDPTDFLNLLG